VRRCCRAPAGTGLLVVGGCTATCVCSAECVRSVDKSISGPPPAGPHQARLVAVGVSGWDGGAQLAGRTGCDVCHPVIRRRWQRPAPVICPRRLQKRQLLPSGREGSRRNTLVRLFVAERKRADRRSSMEVEVEVTVAGRCKKSHDVMAGRPS
jgi:hypothetical protein